jgi:hypothetical protein
LGDEGFEISKLNPMVREIISTIVDRVNLSTGKLKAISIIAEND